MKSSGGIVTWARLLPIALLAALSGLPERGLAQVPSIELDGASGGTAVAPPTQGPVTFTFRNNTNNPTGNTFANVSAPAPTMTVVITNQEHATAANFTSNGFMIGGTFAGDPHLVRMDFPVGGGSNNMYTSLGVVPAGTGISRTVNFAVLMEARTNGIRLAGLPPIIREKLADFDIIFSQPINYPVLHFQGMGGTAGGKNFTLEFDVDPNDSVFESGDGLIDRLSGNAAFVVNSLFQVNHGATTAAGIGSDCNATPAAACGSVQVNALGVTRLSMRAYVRSADTAPWPNNGAEGILLGVSGEIADMTSSFSGVPSVVLPGQTYTGLSASCTNNGPNTARGAFCDLFASAGGVSNVSCTGPSDVIPPLATVNCQFDYTPPLVGEGVTNVTFDSRTGAPNDRNGGSVGTAGNNPGGATTVVFDGTVTGLSVPSDICAPVADKALFSFTPTGDVEGSYTLVSNSPFFYDFFGNPVTNVPLSQETLTTTPGTLFRPSQLTTAALSSGEGEIVVITSLVIGKPGSSMSVEFVDSGSPDHDVFTIEDVSGNILARFPASGSDNTNNPSILLPFTMPASGEVYTRQYIADYGGAYGFRLDGGCLLTNLVTEKSILPGSSNVEGGHVNYRIEVVNQGPSSASNVDLSDLIPSGLTLSGSSPSAGSFTPSTGLWTIGSLANGASATLDLTATINAGTAGETLTNVTTAAIGDQRDPTTFGDILEAGFLVLSPASILSSKNVHVHSRLSMDCELIPGTPDADPAAAIPGACLEYRISMENEGTEPATGLHLVDILDPRLVFVTAQFSGDITTSNPLFSFSQPVPMEDCGIVSCEIRMENAEIPGGGEGEIIIRAILK